MIRIDYVKSFAFIVLRWFYWISLISNHWENFNKQSLKVLTKIVADSIIYNFTQMVVETKVVGHVMETLKLTMGSKLEII